MTPEELKALAAQIAEVTKSLVIADLIEKSKGNRDGMSGLFSSGIVKDAPTHESRRREWLTARDPFKGLGLDFARAVIVNLNAEREGKSAVDVAQRMGFKDIAGAFEEDRDRRKTMQSGTFEAGGSFIPPQYTQEFIALLQVTAKMMSIGMTDVEMTADSLEIPRLTSATQTYWVGENEAPTLSDVGTGKRELVLRELAAGSIISLKLLRAAANFEQIVRNQLVRDFGIKLSATALRSAGGLKTPKGIRFLMAASQAMTQTGITYAQILADLYNLTGLVLDKFVPREGCRFIISDRVRRGLCQVQNAGIFPFKDGLEAASPTLLGFPVTVTLEVPNNLGAGSDSEIYFGSPTLTWHGFGQDMTVSATTEGAVKDGATVRSMFSERAMGIQLVGQHTFELQQDVAWAAITNSAIGT